MKKFFSTGVVFGIGMTSLVGISEAQYFGSPYTTGLAPITYSSAQFNNPNSAQFNVPTSAQFNVPTSGQFNAPIRSASTPLRIGGNYPQIAQQGVTFGHQHVDAGQALQPFANQIPPGAAAAAQQQFGNVVPAQAGQMTLPQPYIAPLPPVNGSVLMPNGNRGPEVLAPMQPIPMNQSNSVGMQQNLQQPQQNFDHYPSTHASVYGNYGSVPTSGPHQSFATEGCGEQVGSCSVNPYLARPVPVCPWIFGANALIFQRIDNDHVRLSSDANNPRPPHLSTSDANMPTAGGFELMAGRYFCGGQYAILGSFWSLQPSDASRTVYGGGTTGVDLYTDVPFNFTPGSSGVEHGITMPGNDAYFWYDNAQAHQIVRGQEFNSFELNFASFALGGAARQGFPLGGGCGAGGFGGGSGWANGRYGRSGYSGCGNRCGGCQSGGGCGHGSCGGCAQQCAVPCRGPTSACGPIVGAPCSPFRFVWLGGIRWFQFNDHLNYTTSQDDAIIGNGNDFSYRNNVQNNLVGFQLGGMANYCCGSRLGLYCGSKFGVFNNSTSFDTFAGNAMTAATVQNGSYIGRAYNLMSSDNNLAFLGEAELGGRVRIINGWSTTCGYRVIGVSGVATAPGQIPYNFSRIDDAQKIKSNEALLLHGVTIGLLYNW